jgi:excisionase family DNA binding protein
MNATLTLTAAAEDLTVAEAARALGVSERTIWRYLRGGRMDGRTEGPPGDRRTLIPAEQVTALAAERGRDPEAEALRAERDRLSAELALARAERVRLDARLRILQRAVARQGRPALADRAIGVVGVALARLPRRSSLG